MYRVIKTIRGKRYHYDQRTWRENGKVKTESIYVGPVDCEQSGTSALRRRKQDERRFEADIEHAMVMVARLTGRSVEDQEAAMEAEFAAQDGSPPSISIPSTFASDELPSLPAMDASNSVAPDGGGDEPGEGQNDRGAGSENAATGGGDEGGDAS